MSLSITEKLNRIAEILANEVVYDTGAEMRVGTEEEIETWVEEVGSSMSEIDIRATIPEFIEAAIDAVNGEFRDFNKIIGYAKYTFWDDEDILERVEYICHDSVCRYESNISNAIKNADSLESLLDALLAAESTQSEIDYKWSDYYGIDLSSLPVFSDNEPVNTGEIWSYDGTRVLRGRWCGIRMGNRVERIK